MNNWGEYDGVNVITKSMIDRINKEQQEANELRIKLKCMRQLYINSVTMLHDVRIAIGGFNHHKNDWRECEAIACKSARENLAQLDLKW